MNPSNAAFCLLCNMRYIVCIIIVLFIFNSEVKSQETDTIYFSGNYSVVIDSILIKGNDQTEEFIILRELTFEPGDTLNPVLASYNRERIYSLTIFNEVKLKPFRTGEIDYLLIEIEESWYIYPLPFVNLKDRDWDKISYGMALRVKNFRGRNEDIFAKFSLGYDPSLAIAYSNPNLVHNLDLFTEFQLGYSEVNNRSKIAENLVGADFDYKFYYTKFFLGKRFGLFHRLSLLAGFDYIEAPFYLKGISASNGRIDRTFIIGLYYSYDTRDLRQYATDGILGVASYEYKGIGNSSIDYSIFAFDFREYRKLFGSLVGKWTFAARITSGDVPYYDFSYLGLGQRIRGHWFDQQEGNNLYFASVELNYWILNDKRLNFYWVPILPKSLLSYRVGFIWQLFIDTGVTRFHGEPLTLRNFETGYGTGFSILLLPYFTMRVEYAVNEKFKGQWIFDIGASF